MLSAFEEAERSSDPKVQRQYLTFVIVGAGPTGVEMAGALSEVAHHTLKHDFRTIDPETARIVLVEAGASPLGVYNAHLQDRARQALSRLRVEFMGQSRVTEVDAEGVDVHTPTGPLRIEAKTVLWSAGVAASPLGRKLAEAAQCDVDRAGRVVVGPDCSLPGFPDVFVIGDLASCAGRDGKPLPGLAPVAMGQGKFVARKIKARAQGKSEPQRFEYHDRGSMAVIGRYAAVANIGGRSLSGPPAWLFWVVVHLWSITQFRNRLLVMWQWAWTYFTRDRHARLITK